MQKHHLDTTVRPQDDFFGYVNNSWLAANPIPPSESTWGTFYVLRDKSWQAVRDIIDELTQKPATELHHSELLLKQLFESIMSFDEHSSYHLASIKQEMDVIAAVTTPAQLAAYLGSAHRRGISPFWTGYVTPDDKDSQREVFRLYQSGLSLPNRDYYLENDARMKDVREKYKVYYRNVAALLPQLIDATQWEAVWSCEHALAKASWTDVELRDIEKNYNPTNEQDLAKEMQFDWQAYFTALGAHPGDNLIVDQPSFIKTSVKIMRETPLDDLKAYLRWKFVNRFIGVISEASSKLSFGFYGTTLSGMTEQKPLWKRAVLIADSLIVGEALGKAYAARHFPESSKTAVQSLVEDVTAAYHARIDRLDWMSDATKQRAHTKLDNIKVFIGYPTVWKSFDDLSFTPENVVENMLAAEEFETDYELAKIGNKPHEEEWEMNAQTVNAYNHPNRLEIVFPAAILQPPFYDPQASYATNLGGIGAVIGHELTHGFDDQGSQFDEHGNTNFWQTNEERAAFDKLADNIVRQANAFETVPGTFLQGKLILGEAIADVGGLELALESLRQKNGTAQDVTDLLINFATCECGHATTERLIELAKTDPHPPSRFRVNCVVCHTDDFYTAYNVTKSDGLYVAPENRARIW